ncbi:MAG: hypothetical protein K2N94_06675, partial [Lachnospiraceae bacterium]|nr:hypothetical protein [Lachnospiraceae bacterium]
MENVSGADIRQAVAAVEAEGISDAQKSEGTGEALGTEEDEIIALNQNTEPVPSDAPQKTPEEILAEQLIDETHDAFLVEKGGRTGTVLVTAERQLPYTYLKFSVWDLNDMEKPIQVFHSGGGYDEFGRYMIVDANFDGWADFGYLKSINDGREYWEFRFWNEMESQFEERW